MPLCHAELVSASFQRRMNKLNVNTFLTHICTFLTGKILNILDILMHLPSTLQNDTKGMTN